MEDLKLRNSAELNRKLKVFHATSKLQGLARWSINGLLVVACGYSFIVIDYLPFRILLAISFGFIYASWLVLTHDAIHHTLTGAPWLDELLARISSWPVLWPHGSYALLHRIHHRANGTDVLDPERIQKTDLEYDSSGRLVRCLIRNQWLVNLFLAAGLGLIWKIVTESARRAGTQRSMKAQMRLDAIGIIVVQCLMATVHVRLNVTADFFFLWVAAERVGGFLLQLRSHVEHYGLWKHSSNFLINQVFCSRNVDTYLPVSLLFNRLNFHSIHHSYPRIPFFRLAEAQKVLFDHLQSEGIAPPRSENGYLTVAWRYFRRPELIITADNRSTPIR